MKTKHYYYFGDDLQSKMESDHLDSRNWDIVRTTSESTLFSFESDIKAYEENCLRLSRYKRFAQEICSILVDIPCTKIISMGVGKGTLEWYIKKFHPEIFVECTDYANESISRLSKLFIDVDNAFVFDMLEDDYQIINNGSCIILYRVSTEFSYNEWCNIFEKFAEAKIQYIIFVPTELLGWRNFLREHYMHMKNILLHGADIFCGWMYSENEFLKMFYGKNRTSKHYSVIKKIDMDDTAIYLLKNNNG